ATARNAIAGHAAIALPHAPGAAVARFAARLMVTPSSRTHTATQRGSPLAARRRISATAASAISSTLVAMAFATHPRCPCSAATSITCVNETEKAATPSTSATALATRASPRRDGVSAVVVTISPLIRSNGDAGGGGYHWPNVQTTEQPAVAQS